MVNISTNIEEETELKIVSKIAKQLSVTVFEMILGQNINNDG